jgi:hypothetical protein
MTMVKQRRSFFVDDILHMVMPKTNDRKRKRSITPDNDNREEEEDSIGEETSNKKFRSYNNHEAENDDDDESKHSQTVDVLGEGGTGEESSLSDNSNSVGNNSGKV